MKIGTTGGILIGIGIALLLLWFFNTYGKPTKPLTTTTTPPAPETQRAPTPTTVTVSTRYVKQGNNFYRVYLQGSTVVRMENMTKDDFIEAIGGIAVYCQQYQEEDEMCSVVRRR